MDGSELAVLVMSGVAAGVVNAIAGGGTFITYGALVLLGLPPIAANATSTVAQLPGYLSATHAYRAELRSVWREHTPLLGAAALGSLAGAAMLLTIDDSGFRRLVPWLLLLATALYALGPVLKGRAAAGPASPGRRLAGWSAQLAVAAYGGFFGAGMGVVMLAMLELTQAGGYHRLNALKNLLSCAEALVAVAVLVTGKVVSWPQALTLIPSVALGGRLGVAAARRLRPTVIRWAVIAVGLLLSAYHFADGLI